MSSQKTVAFKRAPNVKSKVDSWVNTRNPEEPAEDPTPDTAPPVAVEAPPEPAEPMKRFTIDVTEGLHKRIKAQCAMRGVKMADVIRDMLEREFPKS